MKRLLLTLALLMVFPQIALANVCTSQASGLFSAAGTWTSCGGGIPLTTDQIVISVGDTVLLDVDGKGCTAAGGTIGMNVAGTFIFDDSSTGRDGDGWRNFTVVADATGTNEVAFQAPSTFIMGKSDRLLINSTAGGATLERFSGSKLIARGATWDTTVAAITDAAATAAICGNTRGRMFTITPTLYGANAKQYRRVVFKSGKARNWHYNIASVATDGSTFTICTDETDAAQPCTGAGTPYGFCVGANNPADASCTAGATPYAACTAASVSKNNERLRQHAPFTGARTFTTSRASVPAEYGNSVCTAAGNPYVCCTGAAAGNCLGAIPAVGDIVAIIDDFSVINSAGTNGWIVFDSSSGGTPLADYYAGNFSGGGRPATSYGLTSVTLNASQSLDFQYMNWHDYHGVIKLQGGQPTTVAWSVCHDAGSDAGESAGCIETGNSPSVTASSVSFTDNTGYRTRGHAFQLFGAGDVVHVTGTNRVQRNLVHDGCTTDTGECNGIEWGSLDGIEASQNLIYDICAGTLGGSNGFSMGAGDNILMGGAPAIYSNILLNICGSGIVGSNAAGASNPVGYGGQGYGITGNYISNVRLNGILGGRAYGNVVKNYSLRLPNGTPIAAFRDQVVAKGNIAMFDDTAAASADCTGGQYCVRNAFMWSSIDNVMNNKPAITATDNIFSGKFIVFTGAAGFGFGIDWSLGTDQSFTFQHNTCDGHGTVGHCISVTSMTPTALRTVTIDDVAATHLGGTGRIFLRSGNSLSRCLIDRLYRVSIGTSIATADAADAVCGEGGSTETNSTSVGTLGLKARLALEFQPSVESPLLAAGGTPSGSDVGVRGFAFNFDKWKGVWPIMTFDSPLPKSFTNTVSKDTDGDGVIDLFDNCKFVWNPSQLDTNSNDVGDACQ